MLITEFRIGSTAGGLAEHVKRKMLPVLYIYFISYIAELHLLTYHQQRVDYYRLLSKRYSHSALNFQSNTAIADFSSPNDENGYSDTAISADLITDLEVWITEGAEYFSTVHCPIDEGIRFSLTL